LGIVWKQIERHKHIEPHCDGVRLPHGASEAKRHAREGLDVAGLAQIVHKIDRTCLPKFTFPIRHLDFGQFRRVGKAFTLPTNQLERKKNTAFRRCPPPPFTLRDWPVYCGLSSTIHRNREKHFSATAT